MNNILTDTFKNYNIILIDGSYMIFYRYHALKNWDNHKTDKLSEVDFMEKFKKIFIEHLKSIPKKLKLNKSLQNIFIVGKDCPQQDIWRNNYIDNYKAGRPNCNYIKPFFKVAYEELFTQNNGINLVLHLNQLEADDCIALTAKYINNMYQNISQINIITSDKDYMQLQTPTIKLFDLKYKEMMCPFLSKTEYINDKKAHLIMKIIMGDKSDNIPSIFEKCGPKTAYKYMIDVQLLTEKLMEKYNSTDKYKLNKKIIDFDEIPEELQTEFSKKYFM
jgi:5'-3' exonuclease